MKKAHDLRDMPVEELESIEQEKSEELMNLRCGSRCASIDNPLQCAMRAGSSADDQDGDQREAGPPLGDRRSGRPHDRRDQGEGEDGQHRTKPEGGRGSATVVSDKMDKTVVVKVSRRFPHPALQADHHPHRRSWWRTTRRTTCHDRRHGQGHVDPSPVQDQALAGGRDPRAGQVTARRNGCNDSGIHDADHRGQLRRQDRHVHPRPGRQRAAGTRGWATSSSRRSSRPSPTAT